MRQWDLCQVPFMDTRRAARGVADGRLLIAPAYDIIHKGNAPIFSDAGRGDGVFMAFDPLVAMSKR